LAGEHRIITPEGWHALHQRRVSEHVHTQLLETPEPPSNGGNGHTRHLQPLTAAPER